jgi:hypothetical protein
MVYIEINHHHKRATIGHCGSTRDHKCSLGLLTGTSSSMGATSSSSYNYVMTATIISMTTTSMTYTINSIINNTNGQPCFNFNNSFQFSIEVNNNTYVIGTLPKNIGVCTSPGLPLQTFTTEFVSYPGYTTTLTPGEYDVRIYNPPNPDIIPHELNATTTKTNITSPKITLTIE